MHLTSALKALALILITIGTAMVAFAAAPGAPGGLFRDAAVPADGSVPDEPTVLRARLVAPDFALLHRWAGWGSGARIELNLFDDVTYVARLDRVEANPSGSQSWIGWLEGVPYSSVILVVRDSVMVGNITSPQSWYRIRYVGEGVHAVQEMDSAAFPPEKEPVTPLAPATEGAVAGATADDGSRIDVLVVYTDDARAAVGGPAAMESLIDVAIAETNQSYANSLIEQRLNLVGTAELAYNESGFSWDTTLSRLRIDGDGYLDDVHDLRHDLCADEVVLLVEGDQESCGVAYMITFEYDISISAGYAFAVVATNCATGYYSFGHELGHNMGARHDWYVDSATSPYSYSHGYVNSADRWRTIMAYDKECTDQGFNCTRLQYWSNPDKSYGGDWMGVPGGTSTSCYAGVPEPDCDADNHRTLNNTAATVANFRDSGACATYSISGTVSDRWGDGVAGVTVDFDGERQDVFTNEEGAYTQSGFANGVYTVTFGLGETFLSPVLDTVTVSDGDVVHDALGTSPLPATTPLTETFESWPLGDFWAEETDYEGRVEVDASYPHEGKYALLLDSMSGAADSSHAAAILALDLAGASQADLSFWWQRPGEEVDPKDGVYISDDWGERWYSVLSFSGTVAEVYRQEEIDLASAADDAGMELNDHFLIKFQFYGSDSIPTAGYAIDDVQVLRPPTYSISGTVRDGSDAGVARVTVDFGGVRPPVTTGSDGSYTQPGFENGDYNVGLSRSATFFRPVLDTVTVSDGGVVHNALGTSPLPATTPLTETFESVSLSDYWAVETDFEGQARVDELDPDEGNYALLLDSEIETADRSHAAAVLALDLAVASEADLSFLWKRLGEEDDPEDGVYISDDWGVTWHQVLSFSGTAAEEYQQEEIDLLAAAAGADMALNGHFLVKFQCYGRDSIPTAGYAIDDVQVTSSTRNVFFPLVMLTE